MFKNFLAEYGLYWVGDKEGKAEKSSDDANLIDASNGSKRSVNNKGKTGYVRIFKQIKKVFNIFNILPQDFHCNYDLIIKNINELNSLTDYNEAKIDFSNNGATFKTTDSIKLTLYVNGIALFNGPFRPFSHALTRKFCIDIMDGYFP